MRQLSLWTAALLLCLLTGCGTAPRQIAPVQTQPSTHPAETKPAETEQAALPATEADTTESSAPEDIVLTDTGDGMHYTFTCRGEEFLAEYTPDNWKIRDSWRITDTGDITAICQALREVHPIHSADYEGWRTAEDMAYEWQQHNLAYQMLPEDSPWKASARDVDIDPKDQGKSVFDFYNERASEEE